MFLNKPRTCPNFSIKIMFPNQLLLLKNAQIVIFKFVTERHIKFDQLV